MATLTLNKKGLGFRNRVNPNRFDANKPNWKIKDLQANEILHEGNLESCLNYWFDTPDGDQECLSDSLDKQNLRRVLPNTGYQKLNGCVEIYFEVVK